jgi:hypothetical protein
MLPPNWILQSRGLTATARAAHGSGGVRQHAEDLGMRGSLAVPGESGWDGRHDLGEFTKAGDSVSDERRAAEGVARGRRVGGAQQNDRARSIRFQEHRLGDARLVQLTHSCPLGLQVRGGIAGVVRLGQEEHDKLLTGNSFLRHY